MVKNLVLFGAGASFGSDIIDVPPLGDKLFDRLSEFNRPGWGALPKEFIDVFKRDFEDGMIKVSNERPFDLPILQRAMAAFFFNFQPRDSNLYYKLAKMLKVAPKEIAISTLNYERLIEISFLAAGHNLFIGEPLHGEIEYNLPHGCCHLFCENVRGVADSVRFAGLNVEVNGEIKIISDQLQFQQRIVGDAFPPVMSYFEPKKRATAGQLFLQNQRTRLKELIINVENVFVIGIKIREHDTHIWDIIKETNAKFIYCSGMNEKSEFDRWVTKYRFGKENSFIDGFWSEKFDDIYKLLK
jgi:hypothetical protein